MRSRALRYRLYRNAASSARRPSWSPLSFGSSLAAWWDAHDVSTLWQDTGKTTPASADGDPVRVIADKGPNGYDLVAPSDAARGTLKLNIVNGRPVVRFNGTSQYMDATIPAFSGSALTFGYSAIYRGATGDVSSLLGSWESTGPTDSIFSADNCMIARFELQAKGFRGGSRVASGYHSIAQDVPFGGMYVHDGTDSKMYGDKGLGNTVASSGAFAFNRVRVGAVMYTNSPYWYGRYDLGEMVFMRQAATLLQATTFDTYLQRRLGNWTTRQVICEGDSITYGLGYTATSYPVQMQPLFAQSWVVSNLGTSGKTLATMTTEAATRVDPFYNANRTKNVVCIFGGINDAGAGTSAAAIYANMQAYVAARQAAGFQVVVFTLLPHPTPAIEAIRVAYNTLLRADNAGADGIADVAADSRIGDPGDNLDTTYYDADTVHPNTAGYAIIAEIAKTAVEALP